MLRRRRLRRVDTEAQDASDSSDIHRPESNLQSRTVGVRGRHGPLGIRSARAQARHRLAQRGIVGISASSRALRMQCLKRFTDGGRLDVSKICSDLLRAEMRSFQERGCVALRTRRNSHAHKCSEAMKFTLAWIEKDDWESTEEWTWPLTEVFNFAGGEDPEAVKPRLFDEL